MLKVSVLFTATALFFCLFLPSCKHEPAEGSGDYGNFPVKVGRIFVKRCATAGCHNAASAINANGLRLDSWDQLFNGGNNGAAVIPFDIQNSSLLNFINTYPDLGPLQGPTMPLNQTPLSRDEYIAIRDWIANGAPDKDGNIPFGANPVTRQKIYLTMQGCDLVAVIDADRKVVMRYIRVGKTSAIEKPHCVRVSPDGNYAYVSFLSGDYIQKIDTRTDQIVAEMDVSAIIENGQWNVLTLSPDGSKFVVSNWTGNGAVLLCNANTMQLIQKFEAPGAFTYPHATASNAAFDTFYVTAQYGNVVYKISPNGFYKRVRIDNAPETFTAGTRDPHEIIMTPDRSKYFLTCEASNEIRVMDAHADTLLKAIPVGIFPQELAISTVRPYVLATCMEDNNSTPGNYKGSVYVINYNTLEIVQRIDGRFYQPHGITVDDKNGLFYVGSRNASTTGPAPHHPSSCEGRNGWYSVYDLNTLQPHNTKRYEVSVDPYSADARFK